MAITGTTMGFFFHHKINGFKTPLGARFLLLFLTLLPCFFSPYTFFAFLPKKGTSIQLYHKDLTCITTLNQLQPLSTTVKNNPKQQTLKQAKGQLNNNGAHSTF